jgi:hypothetical protein
MEVPQVVQKVTPLRDTLRRAGKVWQCTSGKSGITGQVAASKVDIQKG